MTGTPPNKVENEISVEEGNKKNDVELYPWQAASLAAPKDPEMGALEIEKSSVEKAPEEKAPEESQTFGQWLNETFVEDKWFWLIIVVLLLANIGIY